MTTRIEFLDPDFVSKKRIVNNKETNKIMEPFEPNFISPTATKNTKGAMQDINVTDTDSDYSNAMNDNISPTRDSMVDMQKKVFLNESTNKGVKDLRSLHNNN